MMMKKKYIYYTYIIPVDPTNWPRSQIGHENAHLTFSLIRANSSHGYHEHRQLSIDRTQATAKTFISIAVTRDHKKYF